MQKSIYYYFLNHEGTSSAVLIYGPQNISLIIILSQYYSLRLGFLYSSIVLSSPCGTAGMAAEKVNVHLIRVVISNLHNAQRVSDKQERQVL